MRTEWTEVMPVQSKLHLDTVANLTKLLQS